MRCEINRQGISVESDIPTAVPIVVSPVRKFINSCNITGILALWFSIGAFQILWAQIAVGIFLYGSLTAVPNDQEVILRLFRLCTGGIILSVLSVGLATFAVIRYAVKKESQMRQLPGFISALVSYAVTVFAVLSFAFLFSCLPEQLVQGILF